MSDESNDAEETESRGLNVELLRSYATFARSAIRSHRVLLGAVVLIGSVLTALVLRYVPLTYSCTTTLMTVENAVLDGSTGGHPLVGADGLMMSRQNLEAIVKATDLVHKYGPRRPPALRAKDWVKSQFSAPMTDETLIQVLVLTLETRMSVAVRGLELEIKVDWNDPVTATELAQAAQKGFLAMRRRAEISAFEEKMSIFDSHASETRKEIDMLAAQMTEALEAKNVQANKAGSGNAPEVKAPGQPSFVPRPRVASAPVVDEVIPELRAKLAEKKQRLTASEGERNSRISNEKAKLDELKLKLTPSHPQVVTQEERVAIASNVPSELALLRAEVADMQAQLNQREAMAKTARAAAGGGPGGGTAGAQAPTNAARAEALPTNVIHMLTNDNVDPALSAQISGAVVRYASLRDDTRGAKLALDTAEAAFAHRYQVVIPAEEPSKPTKPNLTVLGIGGIFVSILLAFAIPVLLELKRGVLVERWQVDHLNFPVLGEVRLPERRDYS